MVPLAENTALGIAIMSYNGQLNFGLTPTTTRSPTRDAGRGAALLDRGARRSRGAARARRRRPASPARSGRARDPRPPSDAARRSAAILCSSASRSWSRRWSLSVGSIALLSGFFAGPATRPGCRAAGIAIRAAVPRPGRTRICSPAAAAARMTPIRRRAARTCPSRSLRDRQELDDDQLLQALELGDVVIMYGGAQPPPGLRALVTAAGRPFTPALAAAGQAVILAPTAGHGGLIGLAWTRMMRVGAARRPAAAASSCSSGSAGAPETEAVAPSRSAWTPSNLIDMAGAARHRAVPDQPDRRRHRRQRGARSSRGIARALRRRRAAGAVPRAGA